MKIIVKITFILFLSSLGLLGYEWYQYKVLDNKSQEKEIKKIDKEIDSIHQQTEEKKQEKEALEKDNAWKMEVYHTWEKELKK